MSSNQSSSHLWTNNPMISGVSPCEPDLVNDDLMFLKDSIDENNANVANINTKVNNLNLKVDKNAVDINTLNTDLATEVSNRVSAVNTVQNNLTNEINTRIAEANALKEDLTTETQGRIASVNTVQTNLNAEITNRTNAVNTVQTNLNAEITNRTVADSDLQRQINTLETITNSTANTLNSVSRSLTTETTNRTNADLDLQNQIDALSSKSDVVDIVGTYEDLENYDTSRLQNNDIIKVLTDSTHSNASSYYRYTTSDNSFSYIGSENAGYTKGEALATFVPLKRKVNGKALSSDITLNASDVGAITSADVGNGTLTIKSGSTTLGTFKANQSGNVSVDVGDTTTVNNGTLTVKAGSRTLGTFSANQAGDATVDVGDTTVVNDGTLTIKSGSTTLGTFNANQSSNSEINVGVINDATLTLKSGNTTLGTFSANQSSNKTIDVGEIHDGTLTIKAGDTTLGTFSANQSGNSNISVPRPNDGTLTIKSGDTTVGTFSADQASNSTVNLGNGKITFVQGGSTKGIITMNQYEDATIELAGSGGSGASGFNPCYTELSPALTPYASDTQLNIYTYRWTINHNLGTSNYVYTLYNLNPTGVYEKSPLDATVVSMNSTQLTLQFVFSTTRASSTPAGLLKIVIVANGGMQMDSSLSTTSENPVKNSVITTAINTKVTNSTSVDGGLSLLGSTGVPSGSIAIGKSSWVDSSAINSCIAVGGSAYVQPASGQSNITSAIQIGTGINTTNNSLQIGFGTEGNVNSKNYTLLDGSTGLIPDDRLSDNILRSNGLSNYVTLNSEQQITGKKTFIQGFAETPNASDVTTGNNQIVNVNWVNNPELSTNVVHKTGTEVITGTKTLSDMTISKYSTTLNTSSSGNGGAILFELPSNSTLGSGSKIFESISGDVINFGYKTSGGTITTPLNIDLKNNKIATTTPASTSNDTTVATTAFVKNQGYANTVTQPFVQVTNSAITVTKDNIIYLKNITSATTFSNFSLSGIDVSNKAVTFELGLQMSSTVYSVTFPSNVYWQDAEVPSLEQSGIYLFAFRTFNGGTTWIGNLQGYWNTTFA